MEVGWYTFLQHGVGRIVLKLHFVRYEHSHWSKTVWDNFARTVNVMWTRLNWSIARCIVRLMDGLSCDIAANRTRCRSPNELVRHCEPANTWLHERDCRWCLYCQAQKQRNASSFCTVIAKFYYMGPTGPDRTGPDQTKSAFFVGDPGTRVSDKVRGICPVGSGRARLVEFSDKPTFYPRDAMLARY